MLVGGVLVDHHPWVLCGWVPAQALGEPRTIGRRVDLVKP